MFYTVIAVFLVIFFLAIIIFAALADIKRGPRPKDPIDRHMDENYADIDWLRKGKL